MLIVGMIIRFKKKKNYVEEFIVCDGVLVLDNKDGDMNLHREGGLEE